MFDQKLFLGLIFVLLSGCSFFGFGNQVSLINASAYPVTNIQLKAATKIIWEGQLDPGETVEISFEVNGDGDFEIEGVWQQQRLNSDPRGYGYMSPHDGQDHEIIITTDGSVKYVFKPKM